MKSPFFDFGGVARKEAPYLGFFEEGDAQDL
jgi:hypothetical protein